MKFVYPQIDRIFKWDDHKVPTVVIENQRLFHNFVKDIYLSIEGANTSITLSSNDTPVDMSKNAELILNFIGFNLNQKSLLNKIYTALEKNAVNSDNFLSTQVLLANIEKSIADWAFEFPCDIITTKISASSLIKAMGVELNNNYDGESGEVERIIDYMEFVREFDRDKVFFIVDMRNHFSDSVVQDFLNTVISHQFKILMIESKTHSVLEKESRLTIDVDLCEF